MKKLLVLMLVLCMASMASAALQISVNGDPEPVDSQITIAPSEELVLDIHGVLAEPAYENWMIVVAAAEGSINGGVPVAGGLSAIFPYYYTNYFLGYAGLDVAGSSAVSGVAADLGALDGLLVDGLMFHCEALGDALVTLYTSQDTVDWVAVDSVIIHQIPEPMTMALLGLGGLFLRRRK